MPSSRSSVEKSRAPTKLCMHIRVLQQVAQVAFRELLSEMIGPSFRFDDAVYFIVD